MKKISLIIHREYITRVRKKSFVIMTILGPILMAALMIVPVYFAKMSDKDKTIGIVDESGLFFEKFNSTDGIKFVYLNSDIYTAKNNFFETNYDAILFVPSIIAETHDYRHDAACIYSDQQISLNIKVFLENIIKNELEILKMYSSGLDRNVLKSIKTKVDISTIRLNKGGNEEKTYSELSTVLGIFSGILIYFFIFMFGIQVMRGVIEEKTNRIVEIIVSSVKPFQLMIGKIVGIALVGLTQFILWIVLASGIFIVFQTAYPEVFASKNEQTTLLEKTKLLNKADVESFIKAKNEHKFDPNDFSQVMKSINWGPLLLNMMIFFLFYFIGGYLLYAALFAAIGSAVDSESDTQQFMLPVTIPLIFSFMMAQFVINNPSGPIAFWLSIIPLTSPIIMMVRIPFGVPVLDIVLSVSLLILGFLGTTWMAGKIYRTGILMYGKKVNYKELGKWLFYKE